MYCSTQENKVHFLFEVIEIKIVYISHRRKNCVFLRLMVIKQNKKVGEIYSFGQFSIYRSFLIQ